MLSPPHATQTEIILAVAAAELRTVTRIRLQRITYLLCVLTPEFHGPFAYQNRGPYSEDLDKAVSQEVALGNLTEEQHAAWWGGTYTTLTANKPPHIEPTPLQRQLISIMAAADPVVLDMAATAALLTTDHRDPWLEVWRRKMAVANNDNIKEAQQLLQTLRSISAAAPTPAK